MTTTRLKYLRYLRLGCFVIIINSFTAHSQPSVPKFHSFQPVSAAVSAPQQLNIFPSYHNPILGNSNPIEVQNMQLMRQGGMTLPGMPPKQESQAEELKNILIEERAEELERYTAKWTTTFQKYLQEFLQMNPDSFSIAKAVYLSEAAYYDQPYSYKEFEKAIKQRADIVKQILKAQKLDYKNDLAANYGIQKLYTQQNTLYDSKTGKSYIIKKLGYDFDDYNGDKDWVKMFVTKRSHCRRVKASAIRSRYYIYASLSSLTLRHIFLLRLIIPLFNSSMKKETGTISKQPMAT